ncbi:MAG: glycerol-3-phosphate 1-O-acyltransferase PlsY [Isosphaeraceae bacterium]
MTEPSSTTLFALSALSVLIAYLMGSVTFGYLIARAVKGIDIRTVGSGNLGATNVGRVLGARYFWLVLALDLLKGLVPTLGFPWLFGRFVGFVPMDLPVLIGTAAILGHTFPVYLKFRGGKGVATSVGVVLALDPVSCAVAAVVFGMVLWTSRYMSLASLAGGVGFATAHFLLGTEPLSREHIAMSLFSIAVVALLVVRHRSNLSRIRAGTENRVNIRGPRRENGHQSPPADHPSGRIAIFLALGLTLVSIGAMSAAWLVRNANRPVTANAGPWALRETDRLATGQQRVDRVAFTPDGDRLAGICPRYHRLVTYRVDPELKLRPVAETQLEGRPVSIVPFGPRFLVLQRPAGDQKHLVPGWWEIFDADGKKVGSRNPAGFYPDDFALSHDGRFLFVLSSGRAEGDQKKPYPALDVFALDRDGGIDHPVGRVPLDPTDDPERMNLSASGRFAAIFLAKSKQTAAIDLSDPDAPRMIGRTPAVIAKEPYLSASPDADWIMMPGAAEGDTIAIELPGASDSRNRPEGDASSRRADYLISARQAESVLEIMQAAPQHSLGRFPLLGPFNLGRTRPTGLAYSAKRKLIAVATRTGTIHLVELRSRIDVHADRGDSRIATNPDETIPR